MKIFVTDGSDLNGIQNPLDIRYMRYLRILLVMIGAWPGKALGEKEVLRPFFKIFNMCVSGCTFIAGVTYIRNNITNLSFFELGQSYITALCNGLCLSRYISLVFANKYLDDTIVDFVKNKHLLHHRNNSKFSDKINLYIHKISYAYTLYVLIPVLVVGTFFNLAPMINNINKGAFTRQLSANESYEHSVYYALPFDSLHDFTGFIVVFTYNWYIVFCCGLIFLNYDLVIALLVINLWGHLLILIYNLEHFPRPGSVLGEEQAADSNKTSRAMSYSDDELVEVNRRLQILINYHKSIIKYNADISKAVGINVALYYTFFQISGCLLLLECSQLDSKALIRFGPLTVGLIQLLAIVSVIFELIRSMTDHLVRAVYYMPWECMDAKNRKLVLMLLRQSQIPLGMKAAGMVDVGVRTMASILKTTLSYFMVLKTTEKATIMITDERGRTR